MTSLPTRVARRAAISIERQVASPLMIMMYHRVDATPPDPWRLGISVEEFDRQVSAIAETGRVVSLRDDSSPWRPRTKANRPRIAITFDDGYVCNFRDALPVLERYDAPATFFIATAFLGRPSFWWDRLANIVFGSSVTVAELAHAGGVETGAGPQADSEIARHELHRRLYAMLVSKELAVIEEQLERIESEIGHSYGAGPRPMTHEELVEFASHPLVEIGVHTRHHRRLAEVDGHVARTEMELGRSDLEVLLGPERRGFAFPYGSFNRTTVRLAAELEFPYAVTTVARTVSVRDRRTALPRWNTPRDAPSDFSSWLITRARR